MPKQFFLLAALGSVLPQPTAQDPQPQTLVIHAARMLDVSSGRMLSNATVVVQGDRITAVNPASLPANATTIDLGDVTLLPGFMDLHTHLGSEISEPRWV